MHLHILATLFCDGTSMVPDCSYCLKEDESNVTGKCGGNCQLNLNTKKCMRRGRKICLQDNKNVSK